MRLSLSVALMSAALVVIGAGCGASTSTDVDVELGMPVPGTQTPEMEVNGSVDAGAAGGTQLEGTPPENDTPDADINVGADADVDVMVGATKEFTVIGNNFAFDIKEMRVKKGDTVRITFKNAEGFHDWTLDEFDGAKTAQLQAGGEQTVTFVADKAGTFEYYCSVGKHRSMGMKGSLIVE